MPINNNFKIHAENSTNLLSDTQYEANSERINGYLPNDTLKSNLLNSTLKSSTLINYSLIEALKELNSTTIVDDIVLGINTDFNVIKDFIKTSILNSNGIASKFATPRTINGTNFDGTSNITTNTWGTSRSISIRDASLENVGTSVSVNGSSNVQLRLPSTIKAEINGNASSATKFETPRKINGHEFDGTKDIELSLSKDFISILPIAWGGTGATTALNARRALGVGAVIAEFPNDTSAPKLFIDATNTWRNPLSWSYIGARNGNGNISAPEGQSFRSYSEYKINLVEIISGGSNIYWTTVLAGSELGYGFTMGLLGPILGNHTTVSNPDGTIIGFQGCAGYQIYVYGRG